MEELIRRNKWMKENTEEMEKVWREAQNGELTDFQKGILCGRWDVINFLLGPDVDV